MNDDDTQTWFFDLYSEKDGSFRWLLSRDGLTQALSIDTYADRFDAIQAAHAFSAGIGSTVTFNVVPDSSAWWFWVAAIDGKNVASSGAYPSIDDVQAAATAAEANARGAPADAARRRR